MDLEIRSLPSEDRPKFTTQLESFRAELKRLAKEFQTSKRRFQRKNERWLAKLFLYTFKLGYYDNENLFVIAVTLLCVTWALDWTKKFNNLNYFRNQLLDGGDASIDHASSDVVTNAKQR